MNGRTDGQQLCIMPRTLVASGSVRPGFGRHDKVCCDIRREIKHALAGLDCGMLRHLRHRMQDKM